MLHVFIDVISRQKLNANSGGMHAGNLQHGMISDGINVLSPCLLNTKSMADKLIIRITCLIDN